MNTRLFDLDRLRPAVWTPGHSVTLVGVFATGAASAVASVQMQIALLGVGISVLSGWLVGKFSRREGRLQHTCVTPSESLQNPWHQTATDFDALWELTRSLATLRDCADPLLREHVVSSTVVLIDEIRRLARGQVVFANTETWRAAYEKVLSDPGVTEYRSVAWVKTEDYWKDLPGQQSMQLNYDLIGRGVRIDRILIIGWNLWPPHVRVPLPRVREWIDEQHYRGISIALVREADLVNEQDLLRDFGIYGDRAAGEQELDEESRTVQFVLSFDQPSLRLARDRWDRLQLFAIPYANLLDQSSADR